ncbi:MAG: efflux RND transporter periplasmic adaptor subunit, partial [Litorimonas sp.]
SRTELRAPFTGRVTERQVDAGEFVGMNTRLGEIYATDIMDVRLPLTQSDLRQAGLYLGYEARSGEGVPVTLRANVAGRPATWTGTITRTDSRFDSQSRVLHAYAEVRDPFAGDASERPPLAPGLYVEADIDGPTLDDVIMVPRDGLRGTNEVFLANDDGTLTVRTVEVLSSTRDRVVLGGGVAPGDKVIVSPIRGAVDGMNIEVVETTVAVATTPTEPTRDGA